MKMEHVLKKSQGVPDRYVILFLSANVLQRPFVLFEIETAIAARKKIIPIHEQDIRHGAFDFAREVEAAPEWIQQLLENHESLPWRRRAFERQAVLDRLCEVAGFSKDWQAEGAGEGCGPESEEDMEELAGVPTAAGELPDYVLPREAVFGAIKEVLLSGLDASGEKAATIASTTPTTVICGMGGTGKSVLAVLAVQSEEIRCSFAKICFVTLGAAPDLSALQQTLHVQLTGTSLPEKLVDQQQEALQALEDAARRRSNKSRGILLILDSIW